MAAGVKTGGRQAGTPNKLSADLKAMILGALDDAGGREYLLRQSSENPSAFMVLIGKVLPTTLAGTVNTTMQVVTGVPRDDD